MCHYSFAHTPTIFVHGVCCVILSYLRMRESLPYLFPKAQLNGSPP